MMIVCLKKSRDYLKGFKGNSLLFFWMSLFMGGFLLLIYAYGAYMSSKEYAVVIPKNQMNSHVKSEITPILKPPNRPTDNKTSPQFNFQTVSTMSHTSEVGTVNSPTLDGGIINAADGIPVYHPPINIVNVNSHELKEVSPDVKSHEDKKTAFDDHWVVSSRIKNILQKAATTGKLDYILSQSDKKNLPASVALLPVIESAYRDNAVSMKGAVGAWQLMPETAKENGIAPDQRKDFVPATQAALNYLDQLHQQFGNWTLAFAAYNAGQGRVLKALQKNPQALSIEELDLPLETKNYVMQLKNITQLIEE